MKLRYVRLLMLVCCLVVPVMSTAATPQGGAASVIVEADGVGTTASEATENAWQAAIQSVVGTYVDSTTVVKNQRLIKDEVLTHSRGFIERFRVLEKRRSDGLVEIRIQAEVRTGKMEEKLTAIGLIHMDVDGASLGASLVTQMDEAQSAGQIVRKQLEKSWSIVAVEAMNKPRIEMEKGQPILTQDVRVFVDLERYRAFFDETSDLFRKVAVGEYQTPLAASSPAYRPCSPHPRWKLADELNVRPFGLSFIGLLTPEKLADKHWMAQPKSLLPGGECRLFHFSGSQVADALLTERFLHMYATDGPYLELKWIVSGATGPVLVGRRCITGARAVSKIIGSCTSDDRGRVTTYRAFILDDPSWEVMDLTFLPFFSGAAGTRYQLDTHSKHGGEIRFRFNAPVARETAQNIGSIDIELWLRQWPQTDGTKRALRLIPAGQPTAPTLPVRPGPHSTGTRRGGAPCTATSQCVEGLECQEGTCGGTVPAGNQSQGADWGAW